MSTTSIQLTLVQSKAGRILLHVGCLFRDGHLQWHLKGLLREFAPRM